MHLFDRRDFLYASAVCMAAFSPKEPQVSFKGNPGKTKVVIKKTSDREKGVREVLKMLQFPEMNGKKVFLKPNFNTADVTPGSTHNDVLATLVQEIKLRGAISITVGDRCGPGDTQNVMKDKGIFKLGKDLGFEVLNLETLEEKDWVLINPKGNHWKGGFYMARPIVESEYTITTGCLKTHQYGGHFTMSMKLSVGCVHRKQMQHLHSSPDQRKMIAEINLGYRPQVIVMDGVEAFTDGGPARGETKKADIILAGTDRVAIDAVGLAVLKKLGSNETIMGRKIFEQDQIKRAVEIGLGISGPDQIEIVADDPESKAYAEELNSILLKG